MCLSELNDSIHHVRCMKTVYIFLCVGFLLVSPIFPVSAEIYRWTSSNGQVHYSTNPPSRDFVGHIEVKRNGRWYRLKDGGNRDNTDKSSASDYSTSSPNHSFQPAVKQSEQIIVPYNKQASMIIVDVTINRRITKSFAVDTGATLTVISQEVANALRLKPDPKIPPMIAQTANGPVEAPLVNLDSVAIEGLEVPNITAGILKLEDSLISGLLGLNFLNHFQMTVDANNSQLILKPIQSFAQYQNRDCAAARGVFQQGLDLSDASEKEASYYRKAISLCPDFLQAYDNLGVVYIRQKDAQHAIDIHLKIIKMQPESPEAHYRLGVSYMLANKVSLAQRTFRKVLQLESDHQKAKNYLDYIKSRE